MSTEERKENAKKEYSRMELCDRITSDERKWF